MCHNDDDVDEDEEDEEGQLERIHHAIHEKRGRRKDAAESDSCNLADELEPRIEILGEIRTNLRRSSKEESPNDREGSTVE